MYNESCQSSLKLGLVSMKRIQILCYSYCFYLTCQASTAPAL
jgi:hypothetical protein